MQRNPYIIGLSRQTKVAWLPLPYFGLLLVICVMPYFWTKYLAWILTWPFWYALIFIVSVVNPKSHILLKVLFKKTPHRIWQLLMKLKGTRYIG